MLQFRYSIATFTACDHFILIARAAGGRMEPHRCSRMPAETVRLHARESPCDDAIAADSLL